MRFLLPALIALIVAAGAAAALKSQRPDLFAGMIGFRSSSDDTDPVEEKKRLRRIALLPISNEKKKFLEQRTIFTGASPDMVRLALGPPREVVGGDDKQGNARFRWVYLFPTDERPTILQFEDNRLLSAYHTSAYSDPAQPAPASTTEQVPEGVEAVTSQK